MYSCKCPALWVGKKFSFLENGEEIQEERGKQEEERKKSENKGEKEGT